MKRITNKYLSEAVYELLMFSDINPVSKEMAESIAIQVKRVLEDKWEGRFEKGNFYFKTKKGYVSMNSLSELE